MMESSPCTCLELAPALLWTYKRVGRIIMALTKKAAGRATLPAARNGTVWDSLTPNSSVALSPTLRSSRRIRAPVRFTRYFPTLWCVRQSTHTVFFVFVILLFHPPHVGGNGAVVFFKDRQPAITVSSVTLLCHYLSVWLTEKRH